MAATLEGSEVLEWYCWYAGCCLYLRQASENDATVAVPSDGLGGNASEWGSTQVQLKAVPCKNDIPGL